MIKPAFLNASVFETLKTFFSKYDVASQHR